MNLALHIAKRYLFSKKSHNAINVISMVSVCGIIIATAAVVCVLSVFNGMTSIHEKTFGAFDPDLQITHSHGGVFSTDSINLQGIKQIEGIEFLSETLEQNALLKYQDRQKPIIFKGVSEKFIDLANVKALLIDGVFQLRTGDIDHGVIGGTLAYELGVRPGFLSPLEIFVPKRNVTISQMNPMSSLNQSNVFLSGVFSLNQAKYDENMFIISIELARELLNYDNEVTALDIKLKDDASLNSTQKKIEELVGDKFLVKDRFQQQADVYKMVNMEKWITFLILFLILIIAIFNVVGSMSILIIEKKGDIASLQSMGASNNLIERIFLFEGTLIILIGSFCGLLLGLAICLIQQTFGIIKFGSTPELFVMDAYPVVIQASDILISFIAIISVGFIAILYPIRNLRKSLSNS